MNFTPINNNLYRLWYSYKNIFYTFNIDDISLLKIIWIDYNIVYFKIDFNDSIINK